MFVLRLEDGEILHEEIEAFCKTNAIHAAAVQALGGAAGGSRLVAGPVDGTARPVTPMLPTLSEVHGLAAVGTVFPDTQGASVLHAHAVCGRGGNSVCGCVRAGVIVWQVMEVVLWELTGALAVRRPDPASGPAFLEPGR
jgi:predicted DNA-binding protein with PD1-like motif